MMRGSGERRELMIKTAEELVRNAKARVETVALQDAAAAVAASKAVLVDVREDDEWQQCHIDGAIHASRGLLEFYADPTDPRHQEGMAPSRRTIVVCASGARASLAALTLKAMGYTNVAVLDGGIGAWMDAGLPTHHLGHGA